jgi:hypothetical protein
VAGAYGNCQGITSTTLDEFASLLRIGQFGIGFVTETCSSTPPSMPILLRQRCPWRGLRQQHAGDGDVFFKGMAAGVNHDRAVETGVDAVIAGGFIAVVQGTANMASG